MLREQTAACAVQPVPTESCVLCSARIAKLEGRKMFLEASICHMDSKAHYVDSNALFINMKPGSESIVKQQASGPLGDLGIETDVSKWNDEPRYSSICKDIGL